MLLLVLQQKLRNRLKLSQQKAEKTCFEVSQHGTKEICLMFHNRDWGNTQSFTVGS